MRWTSREAHKGNLTGVSGPDRSEHYLAMRLQGVPHADRNSVFINGSGVFVD